MVWDIPKPEKINQISKDEVAQKDKKKSEMSPSTTWSLAS